MPCVLFLQSIWTATKCCHGGSFNFSWLAPGKEVAWSRGASTGAESESPELSPAQRQTVCSFFLWFIWIMRWETVNDIRNQTQKLIVSSLDWWAASPPWGTRPGRHFSLIKQSVDWLGKISNIFPHSVYWLGRLGGENYVLLIRAHVMKCVHSWPIWSGIYFFSLPLQNEAFRAPSVVWCWTTLLSNGDFWWENFVTSIIFPVDNRTQLYLSDRKWTLISSSDSSRLHRDTSSLFLSCRTLSGALRLE